MEAATTTTAAEATHINNDSSYDSSSDSNSKSNCGILFLMGSSLTLSLSFSLSIP
jgi:hypothetical protein